MANHKIKIEGSADFSSITKSVSELQSTISSIFGKNGVKVLDESSVDFLKGQTNSALTQMTKQLQKLRIEAAALDKLMKSAGGDEKRQADIARTRLDTVKKLAEAEKNIHSLKQTENVLNVGNDNVVRPSFGGAAGRAASQVGSNLPGVREAIGVGEAGLGAGKAAASQGMGAPAIAALGGLAVAAAMASVAIGRASEAFDTFKESVPDLLALSAKGIAPLRGAGAENIANQLGFNQQDIFKTQMEAGGAFGRANRPGGDTARVMNLLTAGRGLGMEPGQLTKAGEQLRQVGGTDSAQKQLGIIIEKAFTSGIDKTQVPHYLEAATGLLTNLNQTGMMNSSKLLNAMTTLTAKNALSPEQASKNIESINSAVAHSQGEQNAFFQSSAMRAGLGGGTILGTQFAVRQGLQGVDLEALQKQVGGSKEGQTGIDAIKRMGLDKASFTQDFAKGILTDFHKRIDTSTPTGAQAGLGFIGQTFGVQTAGEATRVLAILDKIAAGTATPKDAAKLADLQKDPETKWRDDVLGKLDRVALATAQTAARSAQAKFDFGEASAKLFNTLTDALTKLDQTLTGFITKGIGATLNQAVEGTSVGKGIDAAESVAFPIASAVGNALDSAGDFMTDIMGSPGNAAAGASVAAMTGKVNNASNSPTQPSTGPAKPPEPTHLESMILEQKKTNHILEKGLLKPAGAPKIKRDSLK